MISFCCSDQRDEFPPSELCGMDFSTVALKLINLERFDDLMLPKEIPVEQKYWALANLVELGCIRKGRGSNEPSWVVEDFGKKVHLQHSLKVSQLLFVHVDGSSGFQRPVGCILVLEYQERNRQRCSYPCGCS